MTELTALELVKEGATTLGPPTKLGLNDTKGIPLKVELPVKVAYWFCLPSRSLSELGTEAFKKQGCKTSSVLPSSALSVKSQSKVILVQRQKATLVQMSYWSNSQFGPKCYLTAFWLTKPKKAGLMILWIFVFHDITIWYFTIMKMMHHFHKQHNF